MKKVFILMAPSGAGKTEIAKELEKQGYSVLSSYTTRPKRYEDEWGHEFVNDSEYNELRDSNQIVAYSLFNGFHYFCTKSQLINNDIYVCDPDGISYLKQKVQDIDFVIIYIKVDSLTRLKRMQRRGDKIDKIISRMVSDVNKFNDKEYDYKVKNRNFNKAIEEISRIIDLEKNLIK